MKRFSTVSRLLVLALCLMMIVIASGCGGEEKQTKPSPINQLPTDRWIARIDGHEISGAWLRNWAITEMRKFDKTGMPVNLDECSMLREGRELLSKMVIVALEAERRGVSVTDQHVQEKLAEEMSRFPSTEVWLKVLEESGLTRDARREQIRLELLFFRYQNEIVGPETLAKDANDETVRKFYDTYREQGFSRPRAVRLRQIQRTAAKDAHEGERLREREILVKAKKRVQAGESFEDLAKELSTDATALKGGEVGWFDENVPLLPDFKAALLEMNEGELSGILEGPQGYHLFQAIEVKPAGIQPFEEVEDKIRQQIFSEAIKRRMNRHALELREQLVAAEKIEYFNLIPSTGCVMTPKEAEQLEALKDEVPE